MCFGALKDATSMAVSVSSMAPIVVFLCQRRLKIGAILIFRIEGESALCGGKKKSDLTTFVQTVKSRKSTLPTV